MNSYDLQAGSPALHTSAGIDRELKVSQVQPAQLAQDALEFWNNRGQFLAALDRRIPGQIAGLKQLLQRSQDRFRRAAGTQAFFDDRLGDGGGGQVEPFAQLFLKQAEQDREEFIGFVFRRQV